MHSKDGLHPSYNIQTAVDSESHLIAEYVTTDRNNDQGLLHPVAEQVKETLRMDTLHVVADKGYESRKDIEACFLSGVIPDVGFKYDKNERVHALAYIPNVITEEQRQSTKTEDIRACLHAGVLPACYEGSNIRIEKQNIGVESCFLRHADGSVTCPMGHRMRKGRNHADGAKDYRGGEPCRTCTNRCTDSKGQKNVRFGPNSVYVPVRVYGTAASTAKPAATPAREQLR